MNPDLVDVVDDIGQSCRAMNAVVGLMMPQRTGLNDGLDHVDRNDMALLLSMIQEQMRRDVLRARGMVTGQAQTA